MLSICPPTGSETIHWGPFRSLLFLFRSVRFSRFSKPRSRIAALLAAADLDTSLVLLFRFSPFLRLCECLRADTDWTTPVSSVVGPLTSWRDVSWFTAPFVFAAPLRSCFLRLVSFGSLLPSISCSGQSRFLLDIASLPGFVGRTGDWLLLYRCSEASTFVQKLILNRADRL